MTKEKNKFVSLELNDICEIYLILRKEGYISFPLTQTSTHKIESLVRSVNSSYFGNEIYRSREEKAVAYFYFIIKNHPFVDGNKRTASLAFEVICNLNELKPDYKDTTLDEIAVYIEQSQETNHQDFIRRLAVLLFDAL